MAISAEFTRRFRITLLLAEQILQLIAPDLQHATHRNMALSPQQQLLLALRFYACGAFYRMVGDGHGPSSATVCRAVRRVSSALRRRCGHLLMWPRNQDAMEAVKRRFHAIAGIPHVVGCVDGTYIRISVPADMVDAYTDRKGHTSINVMAVSGPDRQFYAVSTTASGRNHDARALRTSGIVEYFNNGGPAPGSIVLGDSAYPALPWLVTPLPAPATPEERRFNHAHRRTRVVVENAFAHLKLRFPVLDCKRMRIRSIERSQDVIVACLILHNLCIRTGDDGLWLEEEAGPQRVGRLMQDQEAAAPAGAAEGPVQEQEELQLLLPAVQRRAGEARRRELVRLFRA